MDKPNQQRVRKPAAGRPLHYLRPTATALAIAACFSGSLALANPTNPTVVHGTASFAQAGSILNITNSPNAIINWGSFSIGVNELTRFLQQSASSAVLNRVIGQDPSAILGALQSNGRVFLLNPNGIVFGSGSQINVAGLVASTLNLSNEDFLANRMRFTDGAGAGSVVNQGSLTGGSVYLIGNAVTNNGIITSPQGEVILAAGNSVELVSPGTPNLRVEIVAPDNEARNLGTITAEAGRIGIYAGLIKQGGVISADSAVAAGGKILLKSTKSTTLEASSVISARGTDGGRIEVLSDMATGITNVAGTLDVSATGSGVGKGGFVETSAANVLIGDSTRVSGSGANGGASGLWLIDPEDFTIVAGAGSQTTSGIGADTLVTNLNSTGGGDVVIATNMLAGTDAGDIFVNAPVSWNSANSLTLTAYRHVVVSQPITNAGSGSIALNAGWIGSGSTTNPSFSGTGGAFLNAAVSSTGGSVFVHSADGGITVNAPISAGGDIVLDVISASGTLSFTSAGSASSGGFLDLIGPNMSLASAIDIAGANIAIEAYRGNSLGDVSLGGGLEGALNLSQADLSKLRLTTPSTGELSITGSVIYVDSPITFNTSRVQNLLLTADYNITQASTAPITVTNLLASAGSGSVDMQAGNMVGTLAGEAVGSFAFKNAQSLTIGSVGGVNGVTANSYTYFTPATVEITVTNGDLTVNKDVKAEGIFSGASAFVTLTATTGGITVNSPAKVSAVGGSEGSGGTAAVMMNAGATIEVKAGATVEAIAGSGWNGGGQATVRLVASGGVTVNGDVLARGGNSTGTWGSGGGNATIDLCAGTFGDGCGPMGAVIIGSTGTVRAYGGEGGEGQAGGGATITLAGGSIEVAGAITAKGGKGGDGGSYSGYGGQGGNAEITLTSTGALDVTGSIYAEGGKGGIGVSSYYGSGSGGNGGDAVITLSSASTINVGGAITALGGEGGAGSNGSNEANGGGSATVILSGNGVTVAAGSISATGGKGGYGSSYGGSGGGAQVNLTSSGLIQVDGSINVTGGKGGDGGSGGGGGGNATVGAYWSEGGSITVSNAGSIAVTGGEGGKSIYSYGGSGGSANITLMSADVLDVSGQITATGGVAGSGSLGNWGGGDARVDLSAYGIGGVNIRNTTVSASAQTGADGAEGHVRVYAPAGPIDSSTSTVSAVGLEFYDTGVYFSAAGNITLGQAISNGYVDIEAGGAIIDGNTGVNVIAPVAYLYGGNGVGSIIGNPIETQVASLVVGATNGDIGVINAGDLRLQYLNAGNGNAAIGSTGTLTVEGAEGSVSANGNFLLAANGDINIIGYYGSVSATGNLVLDAGGNLTIGGPGSYNVAAYGGASTTAIAGGNLSVLTGDVSPSRLGSFSGNTTVITGGNVLVDQSAIVGYPDVMMTVGGVVNINGTLAYGGTIESVSPSTIYVHFPMLTSGGYFVNGVEGVVYDQLTATGFSAGGTGVAAILDTNLFITYGGVTGTLTPPVQILIVAMGESITPPEPEKDKDIFGDIQDEKKKNAPVCR